MAWHASKVGSGPVQYSKFSQGVLPITTPRFRWVFSEGNVGDAITVGRGQLFYWLEGTHSVQGFGRCSACFMLHDSGDAMRAGISQLL